MIVVIILGILAGVVIPAFGNHLQEVKEAGLDTSVEVVQKAIEIYAADHGGTYPGYKAGDTSGNPSEEWFLNQLFLKTTMDGVVDPQGGCGPYLRSDQGFPRNPLNKKSEVRVKEKTQPMPELDDKYGWTFNTSTGKFDAVRAESDGGSTGDEVPEL